MTTFTASQLAAKQQTNSTGVTLSNDITEGDIYLSVAAERSGLETPASWVATYSGNGTPTTDATGTNGVGSTDRCTVGLMSLLAPSVTGGRIWDVANDDSNSRSWLGMQLTPVGGSYDWTFRAASITGSGSGEVNGVSSGSTSPSVTGGGGDLCVVDFAIVRREISASIGTPSFSTTPDIFRWMDGDIGTVGAHGVYIAIGIRYEQSDGTFSNTFNCSNGSVHEGIVGCAVFSNGALSGGPTFAKHLMMGF